MKRCFKYLIMALMICLSIGNLYATDTNDITEVAFANRLNEVSKVGAIPQTGSNQLLTREKAAVMIVNYLGYTALSNDLKESTSYKDVVEFKGEIELVSQLGIMNGVGNQLFAPKASMTQDTALGIVEQLKSKLQSPSTWQHACYAISSSSQMDWIKDYQAISFGWANLVNNQGDFLVATLVGDFKVPSGFEAPIDLAKANGVETYLMVYYDGNDAQALLKDEVQTKAVISQIVEMTKTMTKDGISRGFDGVTIDFEGFMDSDLKDVYVQFLRQLKAELVFNNKKLAVAVPPTLYYKGYDYKGIGELADHMIVMAHDYGARSLTPEEQQAGITITPLTPIDGIYAALLEARNAVGDTSKVALQFSFASIQWQKQNGKVLNTKAYTPSYDKIAQRAQLPGTTVTFDTNLQSTYATYEENGITNIIWYEDTKSIEAKMELARLLGINSFSYWRLGMIPDEIKSLK